MDDRPHLPPGIPAARCAVVGPGRLGTALARCLRRGGLEVAGPLGRDFADRLAADPPDAVLLCVPDGAIADAAAAVPTGPVVGHCSGATPLAALGDRPRLALHPLVSVPHGDADLSGAPCAVAGDAPATRDLAERFALAAGMRPFPLDEADRAAYHAAASVAANHLVAIEDLAERLLASAGLDRRLLGPLVGSAVDAWQDHGAAAALTGPVARGDHATVARQREAVAGRLAPDDVALFDALNAAAGRLATRRVGDPSAAVPAGPATADHPAAAPGYAAGTTPSSSVPSRGSAVPLAGTSGAATVRSTA